jgi:hypothetical protein
VDCPVKPDNDDFLSVGLLGNKWYSSLWHFFEKDISGVKNAER